MTSYFVRFDVIAECDSHKEILNENKQTTFVENYSMSTKFDFVQHHQIILLESIFSRIVSSEKLDAVHKLRDRKVRDLDN